MKKEDFFEICLIKVEKILGLNYGTLEYGIGKKELFKENVAGVFSIKRKIIIINEEWLETALDEDILFQAAVLGKINEMYLNDEFSDLFKDYEDNLLDILNIAISFYENNIINLN